jgi:hypothetical protein
MFGTAHTLQGRRELRRGLCLGVIAPHGPARQNRAQVPDFRADLLGRIAWIESLHPARGARLRSRFARIEWDG